MPKLAYLICSFCHMHTRSMPQLTHLICSLCRMRTRSIPQLLYSWYAICVVYIRGQSLSSVLHLPFHPYSTYEVNTSIAYYLHIHMLRMRIRSIPKLLWIWYVISVVCIRVQYLSCILCLPIVWILRVHRGYMPRLLHHLLVMFCYGFFDIYIYDYMYI